MKYWSSIEDVVPDMDQQLSSQRIFPWFAVLLFQKHLKQPTLNHIIPSRAGSKSPMDCHQTWHLMTARLFANSFNVFSIFIFRKSSKIQEVQSHYKCYMARFVKHATNKAISNIQLVETEYYNFWTSKQGQNCLEVNTSLYIGTFWKFVFYQCLKFPSAICYWNYLLMIKSHPNLCMDEVCVVRKWFAIKFFHH